MRVSAAACCTAAVRISPSLRFAHVEQKLMPLYLLLFRPEQAPSMLAPAMTLRELGDRMDPGCRLPSLVYPGQEHYYMQSPLWPGIVQDVDMRGPPFSCLMDPGYFPSLVHLAVCSDDVRMSLPCGPWLTSSSFTVVWPMSPLLYIARKSPAASCPCSCLCSEVGLHHRGEALMHTICADNVRLQGLVERQVARMWLSPKGAISPLHYDSHMSILTQVRPFRGPSSDE